MKINFNLSSLVQKKEIELIINEIFYSIQGESSRIGLPTIFIRLTGCPLRCQYCDTEYAFTEGKKMRMSSILKKIHVIKLMTTDKHVVYATLVELERTDSKK